MEQNHWQPGDKYSSQFQPYHDLPSLVAVCIACFEVPEAFHSVNPESPSFVLFHTQRVRLISWTIATGIIGPDMQIQDFDDGKVVRRALIDLMKSFLAPKNSEHMSGAARVEPASELQQDLALQKMYEHYQDQEMKRDATRYVLERARSRKHSSHSATQVWIHLTKRRVDAVLWQARGRIDRQGELLKIELSRVTDAWETKAIEEAIEENNATETMRISAGDIQKMMQEREEEQADAEWVLVEESDEEEDFSEAIGNLSLGEEQPMSLSDSGELLPHPGNDENNAKAPVQPKVPMFPSDVNISGTRCGLRDSSSKVSQAWLRDNLCNDAEQQKPHLHSASRSLVEEIMARLKHEDKASLQYISGFEAPRNLNISHRRIFAELKSFSHEIPYISLSCIDNDQQDLLGVVQGPAGSPYEGGIFFIRIHVPSNENLSNQWYPLTSPTLRFITKIYHPNVDEEGRMCLEESWCPALCIEKILLMVSGMMDLPDVEDPMDVGIAMHYVHERESFDETARAHTKAFAKGIRPDLEALKSQGMWWKRSEGSRE